MRSADLEVLARERADGLLLVQALQEDEHPFVERLLVGPDVPIPPGELSSHARRVVVL